MTWLIRLTRACAKFSASQLSPFQRDNSSKSPKSLRCINNVAQALTRIESMTFSRVTRSFGLLRQSSVPPQLAALTPITPGNLR
jgi:hypothetical protein